MTTSAIPANSPAGTGGIPIVPADASGSAAPAGPPAGPPGLTDRLAALDRLVQAGVGRLDQPVLDDAAALLDRAGQRLRLSGEHTVVTLAGGTGSGKSSLFNAICGLELSPTGRAAPDDVQGPRLRLGPGRRGPAPRLARHRPRTATRAPAPSTGGTPAAPCRASSCSTCPTTTPCRRAPRRGRELHRHRRPAGLGRRPAEVRRLGAAPAATSSRSRGHTGVTLIVLNQVDRLDPDEIDDCVTDLRRLLEAEGLADPQSSRPPPIAEDGIVRFRALVDTVAARRARTERLSADIDRFAERFDDYATAAEPPVTVDDAAPRRLVQALTDAAGAPAVAEAMESAYELRAYDFVGWPITGIIARLRSRPAAPDAPDRTPRRDSAPPSPRPSTPSRPTSTTPLQDVTEGRRSDSRAWGRSVRDAARSHAERDPRGARRVAAQRAALLQRGAALVVAGQDVAVLPRPRRRAERRVDRPPRRLRRVRHRRPGREQPHRGRGAHPLRHRPVCARSAWAGSPRPPAATWWRCRRPSTATRWSTTCASGSSRSPTTR